MIGTQEVIIIAFVIVLLFGAKKLPELAQGLGKGIREFRKASSGLEEEAKAVTRKEEGPAGGN